MVIKEDNHKKREKRKYSEKEVEGDQGMQGEPTLSLAVVDALYLRSSLTSSGLLATAASIRAVCPSWQRSVVHSITDIYTYVT